mmetsp:Transcript_1017/g.2798  ORF Transcript_1017/g.2798 Transcript_1017/m.2798 type:complete len:298 (+) Transcript_1017:1095-1988(+)
MSGLGGISGAGLASYQGNALAQVHDRFEKALQCVHRHEQRLHDHVRARLEAANPYRKTMLAGLLVAKDPACAAKSAHAVGINLKEGVDLAKKMTDEVAHIDEFTKTADAVGAIGDVADGVAGPAAISSEAGASSAVGIAAAEGSATTKILADASHGAAAAKGAAAAAESAVVADAVASVAGASLEAVGGIALSGIFLTWQLKSLWDAGRDWWTDRPDDAFFVVKSALDIVHRKLGDMSCRHKEVRQFVDDMEKEHKSIFEFGDDFKGETDEESSVRETPCTCLRPGATTRLCVAPLP